MSCDTVTLWTHPTYRDKLTRREDADSRVTMLKQRMEALKRKRAARPAGAAVKGKTNGVGSKQAQSSSEA